MLHRLLFCFCFFLGFTLFGQEKFMTKRDLRPDWMVYQNNQYQKIDQSPSAGLKTIYFHIESPRYPNDYLEIQSEKSFFLFINGKLINEFKGSVRLKIDSLASRINAVSLLCAVHASRITERDLKTGIAAQNKLNGLEVNDLLRPSTFFRDFVILAGLILMILFVVMLRLHPKLASDYFSITRIFSLREGDDGLSSSRITGSSNILFFIFCSLMISLYLLIILYHLPDHFALPLKFKASSFWSIFWQWIKLSLIQFVVIFSKILITFSLSNLFGMKGIAGTHFLNWIRALLILGGALFVVLFIYYISRGQSHGLYITFLSGLVAILTAWIIIAFLKLNTRIEHSMFHLFSYICATEIIPLLITIKVLFQ
jgi:hypothetical protein